MNNCFEGNCLKKAVAPHLAIAQAEEKGVLPEKPAIIVDIDDCLLDSRMMSKYLPKDRNSREGWDEFAKHYDECEINPFVKNMIEKYKHTHVVLFVTSREATDETILTTKAFIENIFNSLEYQLFMRDYEDYRPSEQVKKSIYQMCIKHRYEIEFAIDDKKENVEMWQNQGINCLQNFYGKAIAGAV